MAFLKRQSFQIILLVLVGCITMSLVESVLQPIYIYKSILKILVFLTCIALYCLINNDISIFRIFKIQSKKQLFLSIFTGICVYSLIICAYLIAKTFVDFSTIISNLLTKENISKENFVFVAIYISIVNSFLEELFFRGFAYIKLKQFLKEPFAYGFSSVTFALYHIFIMSSWFSFGMFVLLLFSLVIAGCIFNYFDRKSIIYNSWLIHMSANLSINTIGFILLGMIKL